MGGNAPLAKLRRVGFSAAIRLANPARRGFVEIEQTFEGIRRDDLHRGVCTHRAALEHLHHDAAREIWIDHIAAIGIGADRESLALIRSHDLFALAEEGIERGLVAVHVVGAELASNGATTASVHRRPILGLAVEVNGVTVGIGHNARLPLGSQHGLVSDLLRLLKVCFDLLELGLGHDIGAALLLDLGKPLVIGLLEFFESGVQCVDGTSGLLDFL